MSTSSLPPGFYPSYDTCLEVSQFCPVQATTLGYFPNKGVNVFLAFGYGLAAVVTIVIGVWKRTWGFSIAVAAGCALECVGKSPPYSLFSVFPLFRPLSPSSIQGS